MYGLIHNYKVTLRVSVLISALKTQWFVVLS